MWVLPPRSVHPYYQGAFWELRLGSICLQVLMTFRSCHKRLYNVMESMPAAQQPKPEKRSLLQTLLPKLRPKKICLAKQLPKETGKQSRPKKSKKQRRAENCKLRKQKAALAQLSVKETSKQRCPEKTWKQKRAEKLALHKGGKEGVENSHSHSSRHCDTAGVKFQASWLLSTDPTKRLWVSK